VLLCLVFLVSLQKTDYLKRRISEVTCYVPHGTLNVIRLCVVVFIVLWYTSLRCVLVIVMFCLHIRFFEFVVYTSVFRPFLLTFYRYPFEHSYSSRNLVQ